jgi:Polyketide cyclase / dehydrase and lipid transport
VRRGAAPLAAAAALALGARTAYRLLASGALTLDLDLGRRLQPLGPLVQTIAASPEDVFEVVASPYLGRTPRALASKLHVWERGSDIVLAAHFTHVKCGLTTTLETIRFQRPDRIEFRLVRGPVPHLVESFLLTTGADTTELRWQGELGTDLWALGECWGRLVARAWTQAVRASLHEIGIEAERRSRVRGRDGDEATASRDRATSSPDVTGRD